MDDMKLKPNIFSIKKEGQIPPAPISFIFQLYITILINRDFVDAFLIIRDEIVQSIIWNPQFFRKQNDQIFF